MILVKYHPLTQRYSEVINERVNSKYVNEKFSKFLNFSTLL